MDILLFKCFGKISEFKLISSKIALIVRFINNLEKFINPLFDLFIIIKSLKVIIQF